MGRYREIVLDMQRTSLGWNWRNDPEKTQRDSKYEEDWVCFPFAEILGPWARTGGRPLIAKGGSQLTAGQEMGPPVSPSGPTACMNELGRGSRLAGTWNPARETYSREPR